MFTFHWVGVGFHHANTSALRLIKFWFDGRIIRSGNNDEFNWYKFDQMPSNWFLNGQQLNSFCMYNSFAIAPQFQNNIFHSTCGLFSIFHAPYHIISNILMLWFGLENIIIISSNRDESIEFVWHRHRYTTAHSDFAVFSGRTQRYSRGSVISAIQLPQLILIEAAGHGALCIIWSILST